MLAENGLLAESSATTRNIIRVYAEGVAEHVRVHLQVVSCFDCTAPKACCSRKTRVFLHEAVAIVARLRKDGRDTPELRASLKEAAHYMETTPQRKHTRPCVFLDGDERCTVYDDRPSVCGTLVVSSPAIECGGDAGNITRLANPTYDELPHQLEEQFVLQASLRRIDRQYKGALPRMVLICLEAWDRRDYVTFLAQRCLPAAHRWEKIAQER
jgi:Fe-S-cluster containining protein